MISKKNPCIRKEKHKDLRMHTRKHASTCTRTPNKHGMHALERKKSRKSSVQTSIYTTQAKAHMEKGTVFIMRHNRIYSSELKKDILKNMAKLCECCLHMMTAGKWSHGKYQHQ